MGTALFVGLLLAVIAVIQGIVWFFVLRALRQLTTKLSDELHGTPVVLGPERVHYQGTTGGNYPRARGFIAAALTHDRLVVRRLASRGFDVPVRDITGVSQQVRWRGHYRNGKPHVVIQTNRGEFAIQPTNPDAWLTAIEATLP
jgi:hypothetical protein